MEQFDQRRVRREGAGTLFFGDYTIIAIYAVPTYGIIRDINTGQHVSSEFEPARRANEPARPGVY